MTTIVWVDVDSGTWGNAGELYFLEVDDNEVDEFSELSDNDRSEVARELGWKSIPRP